MPRIIARQLLRGFNYKIMTFQKRKPAWNKGLKMSPQWGEQRAHSFRGKKHSEETKRRISEANRGHTVTPEMREKMSMAARKRLAKKANNWQGGKDKINHYGYVLEFDETLPPTRGGRYTPRYRRVMEEKIGRKLEKYETVHHINGIKDDDNPFNLYLCTLSSHRKMHNEMSQLVTQMYREGKVMFNDGRYILC